MISSEIFYTKFSKEYGQYAENKKAYLSAVNVFILNESDSPLSLVDVGSGDGRRGKEIADSLGIQDITFIDNSDGMNALSKQIPGVSIVNSDISDDNFRIARKYDLVLCLWNVLGHIVTAEKRKIAIKNLANLIKDDGRLFIDVNNRHNIFTYGKFAVAKNMVKSLFTLPGKSGNFDLSFKTDSEIIKTKVHIFTPTEIEKLIRSAGLIIEKRQIINYSTGELDTHFWNGQLVYKIKRQ